MTLAGVTPADRGPRRPRAPLRPKIFEIKHIEIDSAGRLWTFGQLHGPVTLEALIDLVPLDVGLDQVFVDCDAEEGRGITLQRATLRPGSEERIQTYREEMATWEVRMEEWRKERNAWLAAKDERTVEAARAELVEIEKRKDALKKRIREATTAP